MVRRLRSEWGRSGGGFSKTAVLSLVVGVLLLTGATALAANPIACAGGLCSGTTGDDEMTGTDNVDYLYANDGNDTLLGHGSFDDLRGQLGNDRLDGGRGSDQYNFYEAAWGEDRIIGDRAGAEDWLIFQAASGGLTIDLVLHPGVPEVQAVNGATINIADGVSIEWVQGSPDKDEIKGTSAENYLSGANNDDFLSGRGGNDRLQGDIIEFGNTGNDTLRGGSGRDVLTGGPGNDTFFAKDGEKDHISCGTGTDTFSIDLSLDVLDDDCSD